MAWNRSTNEGPKVAPKADKGIAWKRGILVGGIAVAGGVVAFLIASSSSSDDEGPSKRGRSQIAEVTPAPAPKAQPAKPKEKPTPYWEKDSTNGLTEVQMRKWWVHHRPAPSWTNTTSLTEPRPRYAIFDHHSENEIAMYLSIVPGQTLVGTPRYGEAFKRDFLKSLTDVIVVKDDDPPDVKELKRAVIKTKIELKERMDAGEDIGQILLDTRKELQNLAMYKQSLKNEMLEVLRGDREMSAEDLDATIDAANKMLEEKGVAPIKLGFVARTALLRRGKVGAATPVTKGE